MLVRSRNDATDRVFFHPSPLSLVHTDRQYLGGVGEDVALVYGSTTPLGSIAMSHPSPYWWAAGVTARSGASQWEVGEVESGEVGGRVVVHRCAATKLMSGGSARQRTYTPQPPIKEREGPAKPWQSSLTPPPPIHEA